MNAMIEVIGVSGGDVPSYDEYKSYSTGQRLHVRIAFVQGSSEQKQFDIVTVTLQGALHSMVGSKIAVEKLLHLSQQRQRPQFDQRHSTKDTTTPSMHTELTFDLPEVIPLLDLSGTTTVTRSSTLVDRHRVSGQAHIRYWLEADFKGNGSSIKNISCPVDFSKLMKPSQMNVLASSRSSSTRQPILLQRKRFCFKRKSLPTMTLEVPHELGVVASTAKATAGGHQQLSIPLTISTPHVSGGSEVLSHGIENVSVIAKWHTTKRFGTAQLVPDDFNGSPVISKSTVVRQNTAVSFPPFFQDATVDRPLYSSMTSLDLVLPDTIADSSINTSLVSISYQLELEASFDIRRQNGRSAPCRSNMRIPLQVHMT